MESVGEEGVGDLAGDGAVVDPSVAVGDEIDVDDGDEAVVEDLGEVIDDEVGAVGAQGFVVQGQRDLRRGGGGGGEALRDGEVEEED